MDSIEQLQNIRGGSPPTTSKRPVPVVKSLSIDDEAPANVDTLREETPTINSPIEEPDEELTPVALAARGGQSGAFKRMPSRKPTLAKRGSIMGSRSSIITAADAINMGEKKEQTAKKKWGRVRSIFLKPDAKDRNSFLTKLKEGAEASNSSKITSQSNVQSMIDSMGKQEEAAAEEEQ